MFKKKKKKNRIFSYLHLFGYAEITMQAFSYLLLISFSLQKTGQCIYRILITE